MQTLIFLLFHTSKLFNVRFRSSLGLNTRQVRFRMQAGHSAGQALPGRINSVDSKVFCPVAEQQNSQNEVCHLV